MEDFDALKATNQPESTVELGYMCPRGLVGQPAVTLIKKWKYKEMSTKMCTPFGIGFNSQYGPYVHFGYITLS